MANSAFFPIFLVIFLRKKRNLWACHSLFSDFAPMSNADCKKRNTKIPNIYIYIYITKNHDLWEPSLKIDNSKFFENCWTWKPPNQSFFKFWKLGQLSEWEKKSLYDNRAVFRTCPKNQNQRFSRKSENHRQKWFSPNDGLTWPTFFMFKKDLHSIIFLEYNNLSVGQSKMENIITNLNIIDHKGQQ